MAMQNSVNNMSNWLSLGPADSGDHWCQFAVNGVNKFRQGVDDTDNTYKISIGNALGTNDTSVTTHYGEITKPLTPAFLAYLSATASNVSGDGTAYTVACNTEVFDQGGDYNNGTYTFTAPVTGRYMLFGSIYYITSVDGGEQLALNLNTSNRTHYTTSLPTNERLAGFYGYASAIGISYTVLAEMDAADTAHSTAAGDLGNKTDDVKGDATTVYTWFAGYLAT